VPELTGQGAQGAGVSGIIAEKEAKGETVPRDAFGHAKLDSVNVGKYYGDKLGALIGAEKVMVQKSGYFARSAAPNSQDLKLIKVRLVPTTSSPPQRPTAPVRDMPRE
jgi:pyrophosphate--fructose-6-phosphate 1-phosphotransferase